MTPANRSRKNISEEMGRLMRTRIEADALKKAVKSSLWLFAKVVCGFEDILPTREYPDNKLHKEMCDFVQDPTNLKTLVLVARGHLKSSLISIALPLWLLVNDPNTRILIVSRSADLAEKFIRAQQAILTNSGMFEALFPEFKITEDWRKRKAWSGGAYEFPGRTKVLKEMSVEACGVSASRAGIHVDVVIMDDIIAEGAARSESVMESAIEWYQLHDCLFDTPSKGRTVVAGTRWSHRDLYKFIVENDKQFKVFHRGCYGDDGEVLYPVKFSRESLRSIRAKMTGYQWSCTPAGSLMTMPDLTTVPIEHLRVGDEVLGFLPGGTGKPGIGKNTKGVPRLKYISSTVMAVGHRIADVIELTMESGRTVRCTKDHKWFSGRRQHGRKQYMVPGVRKLMRWHGDYSIPEISPAEMMNWRYLAGLFDDEGTLGIYNSVISISQSRTLNPEVCDRIEIVLGELGIDWTYIESSNCYNLKGGRRLLQKFFHYGNPEKWRDRFLTSFLGRSMTACKDKVVAIDNLGPMMVYSVQTTTGNYINQGYLSKNCQYLNEPSDPDRQDFQEGWFKKFCFEESGKDSGVAVVTSDGKRYNPFEMDILMAVDPAVSEKKSHCDNAIIVAARNPEGKIFVLEAYSEKGSPSEIVAKIMELHRKWSPRMVFVEAISYQKALIGWVEEQQLRSGYCFAIRPVHPGGQGKEERIRSLEPYARQGLIHLRMDQVKLLDQFINFPLGKLVDMIDAMSYLPTRFIPIENMDEPFFEDDPPPAWAFDDGRSEVTGY